MAELSEKLLKEILIAFSIPEADNMPSEELLSFLADASGKLTEDVKNWYVKLYQDYNNTDESPYDPMPIL